MNFAGVGTISGKTVWTKNVRHSKPYEDQKFEVCFSTNVEEISYSVVE